MPVRFSWAGSGVRTCEFPEAISWSVLSLARSLVQEVGHGQDMAICSEKQAPDLEESLSSRAVFRSIKKW